MTPVSLVPPLLLSVCWAPRSGRGVGEGGVRGGWRAYKSREWGGLRGQHKQTAYCVQVQGRPGAKGTANCGSRPPTSPLSASAAMGTGAAGATLLEGQAPLPSEATCKFR